MNTILCQHMHSSLIFKVIYYSTAYIHSIFLTIPLFISVEVQSDFFSLTNNAVTDIHVSTLLHT